MLLRHQFACAIICVVSLVTASTVSADYTMTITPSSAPNFFGSPSWLGYQSNSMISIENGLGDIGDRDTDPTAYVTFNEGEIIAYENLIVSDFNSWLGEADPAAPFAGERGNRVHFGLHIEGDGIMQFRLSDLSYELSSSDDDNSLGFTGDYMGSTYNDFRLGIDWGADRMKGGGDDTIITAGSSDQFIDELVFVGNGNALDASMEPGTNQEKLDSIVGSLGSFLFTGAYFLNDINGNDLIDGSNYVVVVPEPGSILLLSSIGFAIAIRRRRQL